MNDSNAVNVLEKIYNALKKRVFIELRVGQLVM